MCEVKKIILRPVTVDTRDISHVFLCKKSREAGSLENRRFLKDTKRSEFKLNHNIMIISTPPQPPAP